MLTSSSPRSCSLSISTCVTKIPNPSHLFVWHQLWMLLKITEIISIFYYNTWYCCQHCCRKSHNHHFILHVSITVQKIGKIHEIHFISEKIKIRTLKLMFLQRYRLYNLVHQRDLRLTKMYIRSFSPSKGFYCKSANQKLTLLF